MSTPRADVLQGTLDLIVLRTLDVMGPLHGYGIAVRILQVSQNVLQLNQGTLYPALQRLLARGWIAARWGVSERNRRARFYSLTAAGRRALAEQSGDWERTVALMARLLGAKGEA
jgi:transcriptional regulator